MLFRIGKAWRGEQRRYYHGSQNAKSQTVWYKREGQKVHHDLNKLRGKLASKTKSVARLPPCEVAFQQHKEHTQWLTNNWMSSHIAKQDLGSPYEHGWKKDKIPIPVMYEVPKSFELLQQMTNTCIGRNVCKKLCFSKSKYRCTEMCGCHGLPECRNTLTKEQVICGDEEDIWVTILSFHSICPHSIFFSVHLQHLIRSEMSQIICMVCKICNDF